MELPVDPAHAFDEIECGRGDCGPRLRDSPLWYSAFAAQAHVLGGAPLPDDLPSATLLAAHPAKGTAARRAASALVRLAVLSFDVAELDALHLLIERAWERPDENERLHLIAARGWIGWLRPSGTPPDLGGVAALARARGLAALTVELETLSALLALTGKLDDAVAFARRASRMAKAEEIPHAEILANVVLARVRRFQNRPHLTQRILAALQPHSPPIWQRWMAWEQLMAGQVATQQLAPPAASLRAFLVSVLDGVSISDAEQATARSVTLVNDAVAAPLARDAFSAVALMLASPVGELDGWQRGVDTELPSGRAGLAYLAPNASDATTLTAWVLALPDGAALRLPPAALGIACALHGAGSLEGFQPRVDTGLTVLAFHADLEISEYFRRVYGFDYAPKHAQMLAMHLTRMRQRLGSHGDVQRQSDSLRLRVTRAVVFPDPRCAELLPQRVLRALAQAGGGLPTKELARLLSIPLRTAQRVVKELVEDGALSSAPQGRQVLYDVEDTTFSEPTMSRVFPAPT